MFASGFAVYAASGRLHKAREAPAVENIEAT